ncbi:MAG: GNAT family N-acetyltransferase [Saprospiraceae bacterium]|nr:GNAT family N-acetyltransferase [Saprospiraceae bacterium]
MQHWIQKSSSANSDAILALYREVLRRSGGIIRVEEEVTNEYVQSFLQKSINSGIALHVTDPDQDHSIIAEVHAYKPGLSAFRHILADLTIVVHPDFQGQGLGKQLFLSFLEEVKANFPEVLRVELFVREQNTSAITFYQKMGFIEEGRLKDKILNLDGSLETPIEMTWFNPNFQSERGLEAKNLDQYPPK